MLQFGEPEPGVVYAARPAAFGIAEREGKIAVVRVRPEGGGDWLDLPGGAVDPGEDELDALVREFGEEAGLVVRPGKELVRVAIYFRKADNEPVNNQGGVYAVEVTGEDPALKIEADHQLVWIDPTEAVKRLRHDSHAWAVASWLRRTGRGDD
ncbi:8-oxo-dGTP diphosphatase [Caulobacter ginsengisoli]|uniref:8-oxo-dGTP diphosphatase n=1 Tax=Caulobacter ginsengisoli TaxID=400775 RepID=A0ABU0IP07_9CAUL|nr:NUDIX domain-containing protein [Caulobacter ginsengisoli]MDQ0463736.1 8-oxo-dGTP diphosphatase [Caulobacter ginsengisoli]